MRFTKIKFQLDYQ